MSPRRRLLTLCLVPFLALLPGSVRSASQAMIATRAEVVFFLFSNSPRPLATSAVPALPLPSDIPQNAWYAPAMGIAVRLGIVTPDAQGLAHPLEAVPRGEFLRMLTLHFSLPRNLPHHFTDVRGDAPIQPFVGAAEHYHLLALTDPTKLDPERPVTYTEVAGAVRELFRQFPLLRSTAQDPLSLTSPESQATSAAGALPRLLPQTSATKRMAAELLALVNVARLGAGLPLLARNTSLEHAATLHAKDMFDRGYFSHFTPEGMSYVDRIRDADYFTVEDRHQCSCEPFTDVTPYVTHRSETAPNYFVTAPRQTCHCTSRFAVGENIAKGQQTSPDVFAQWMASPSHRATILQPRFTETGIGIVGTVWVQTFGTLTIDSGNISS